MSPAIVPTFETGELPREGAPEPRDRFSAYTAAVQSLQAAFPPIHQLSSPGESIETVPGWVALRQRLDSFVRQGGRPILVATLYGPTGAGKSTLFEQLTSIAVPRSVIRPCTYSCVVAVPAGLDSEERVSTILPDFRAEPLKHSDQLKVPDLDPRHIYFVAYRTDEGLPLVLADVPDFNGIRQDVNRPKAEAMLQRAEVVLFLVYPEAYANDDVVRELGRCCRLAARLAVVLTRVPDAELGSLIWSDLLRKISTADVPAAKEFRELRGDGRTLAEFLGSGVDVFFQPRADQPKLEDVRPLRPDAPSLPALLRGLEAENIVLQSLLEPARPVIAACRLQSGQARTRMERLGKGISRASTRLEPAAAAVAGCEFPIGRMMQLVMEEAQKHQNTALRTIGAPIRWLWSLAGKGVGAMKNLVKMLQGGGQDDLRPRHQVEEGFLKEESLKLEEAWRTEFPDEVRPDGLLGQTRRAELRSSFRRIELPTPTEHWEVKVRKSVAKWAADNPMLSNILPFAADILGIVGIGLLVIDLTFFGGMNAALVGGVLAAKLVAAAAAGSIVAKFVLDFVHRFGLGQVLDEADASWREQRTRELAEHLRRGLFEPLFRPWQEELQRLEGAPIEACEKACTRLEEIANSLRGRA